MSEAGSKTHTVERGGELMWVFGTLFVALGVSICSKVNLGVSMIAAPAFIICEALAPVWHSLSVGVTEYIIQGLMLAVLCVVVRRFNWKYLCAFAVAVIYGYALNLFLWIMRDVSFDTVAMRWIMLIVGDSITATGVACFFRTYLPLQVYELFVAEIADKFGFNINKTKWCFDITLLVISVILALTLFGDASSLRLSDLTSSSFHSIGLGTIVTTAINSPIIAFAGKLLDRIFGTQPRFPKLKEIFGR